MKCIIIFAIPFGNKTLFLEKQGFTQKHGHNQLLGFTEQVFLFIFALPVNKKKFFEEQKSSTITTAFWDFFHCKSISFYITWIFHPAFFLIGMNRYYGNRELNHTPSV